VTSTITLTFQNVLLNVLLLLLLGIIKSYHKYTAGVYEVYSSVMCACLIQKKKKKSIKKK